jgi:hypothetical protein
MLFNLNNLWNDKNIIEEEGKEMNYERKGSF